MTIFFLVISYFYVPIIFPNILRVFPPKKIMMQLILIFLCTIFLKFEVVYQSCHSDQTLFWLVPFILIYLLLSNWLRVYWHRPSQHSREHYIIYSTIYFYNVFYSKYLWQQAKIAMLGLFVLNLSLSESTIHGLQCAKNIWFLSQIKKIVWHFSTKNITHIMYLLLRSTIQYSYLILK